MSNCVEIQGIGVHNGRPVTLKVLHTEKGSGIKFINTSNTKAIINAIPRNINNNTQH